MGTCVSKNSNWRWPKPPAEQNTYGLICAKQNYEHLKATTPRRAIRLRSQVYVYSNAPQSKTVAVKKRGLYFFTAQNWPRSKTLTVNTSKFAEQQDGPSKKHTTTKCRLVCFQIPFAWLTPCLPTTWTQTSVTSCLRPPGRSHVWRFAVRQLQSKHKKGQFSGQDIVRTLTNKQKISICFSKKSNLRWPPPAEQNTYGDTLPKSMLFVDFHWFS